MRVGILFFLPLIALAFSCNEKEMDYADTFEVTVAGVGMDCGFV